MVQADVLGYSMGGVLARIYAAGDKYYYEGFYRNSGNFGEGSINKLITLDSPHKGSFLADFGIQSLSLLEKEAPSLKGLVVDLGNELGMDFTQGALYDLMTVSEPIKNINSSVVDIPVHAIAGDVGFDFKLELVLGPEGSYLAVSIVIDPPEGGVGPSDLVVSVESQKGGLEPSASSVFTHWHSAAVSNEDVSDEVVDLLNTQPEIAEGSLFSKGFPVMK